LLFQQAALQQTGKASFIDYLSYDSEHNRSIAAREKEILYQSAVDYAKANNQQLGDALAEAQLNTLSCADALVRGAVVPDRVACRQDQYLKETGTTVPPGGFMSAANRDLNVQTLNQIGSALQQLKADDTVNQAGTQALPQSLPERYQPRTLIPLRPNQTRHFFGQVAPVASVGRTSQPRSPD
jgi:hypothetical protein